MTPEVKAKREIFKQAVEAITPSRLIFIDESGVHCGMSRWYGRAIGENRAKGYSAFYPGQRTTLIGALGCRGFTASLFGEWYTEGLFF